MGFGKKNFNVPGITRKFKVNLLWNIQFHDKTLKTVSIHRRAIMYNPQALKVKKSMKENSCFGKVIFKIMSA